MQSFYPGPSKVYPEALDYIQDAFDSGIVSINHRSTRFETLYKETIAALQAKWAIPKDYSIYFISSATEAWEIVAQSLVDTSCFHAYNGAFGKKWAHYSQAIVADSRVLAFGINESLADIREQIPQDVDTICLVQSETSNGTSQEIKRSNFPDALIAVDATSSMGGIILPWLEADVWLSSVQKCMGIPAGMGIMICSPRAVERAKKLNRRDHYNDLLLLDENSKLYQTHYTPNILSIYLIHRLTTSLPSLSEIDAMTREKMAKWTIFWEQHAKFGFRFLVENPALRLPTVLALQAEPEKIAHIQTVCAQHGIELGKGYGVWKETTIRIANFPSHTLEDIDTLINILSHEL